MEQGSKVERVGRADRLESYFVSEPDLIDGTDVPVGGVGIDSILSIVIYEFLERYLRECGHNLILCGCRKENKGQMEQNRAKNKMP